MATNEIDFEKEGIVNKDLREKPDSVGQGADRMDGAEGPGSTDERIDQLNEKIVKRLLEKIAGREQDGDSTEALPPQTHHLDNPEYTVGYST